MSFYIQINKERYLNQIYLFNNNYIYNIKPINSYTTINIMIFYF